MEDGGKGTEVIGSRGAYLTHHVDHDGAGVTQGGAQRTAAIAGAHCGTDLRLGGSDRHACHHDGTIARDGDVTLRGDGQLEGLLRSPVDIDDHLVTRTQHVVLGRGDIHIRLEAQRATVENVMTEDLLTRTGGDITRRLYVMLHLSLLVTGIGIDLTGGTYLSGI